MSSLKPASQAFPLRLRGRPQLDLETCKARLEDIGTRLKLGKISEAEADAARLALLSQRPPSRWKLQPPRRATVETLIAPVAVFLVIAGIGALATYMEEAPGADSAISLARAAPEDETLARLMDYTRSIGATEPAPAAAAGKLPDVDSMIQRLAARLKAAPDDLDGWTMLGRSYFHTGHYEQAAAAFAKATALDPNSAELKQSYDEAKAKAAGTGNAETAAASQASGAGISGDGAGDGNASKSVAMLPPEHGNAAIRSMVDRLASRLETSPRDVDGWMSLMRSRVVLGEGDVAATALRKALDVFKDDAEASAKLTAAASDLGLKVQ